MKIQTGFACAALSLLLAGCGPGVKSTRRFHLPQGNAEKGRAAFIALNCTACHTVNGVELPRPTVAAESIVVLGGDVVRMRTYGDLLTSIIHPRFEISEKAKPTATPDGKTTMPVVNDRMTVSEMVDLVTFLQPRYTELPPLQDWYYPL
jgi:hypothetical protein